MVLPGDRGARRCRARVVGTRDVAELGVEVPCVPADAGRGEDRGGGENGGPAAVSVAQLPDRRRPACRCRERQQPDAELEIAVHHQPVQASDGEGDGAEGQRPWGVSRRTVSPGRRPGGAGTARGGRPREGRSQLIPFPKLDPSTESVGRRLGSPHGRPTFQNVVNGEPSTAASGETYDVIDPTTGEVYATAPMSVPRTSTAPTPPPPRRSSRGATPRPRSAPTRCSRSPTPSRRAPRRSTPVECRDTGKPLGLTMAEEMPYASDHFRFFAGAARVLEGRSAGEYMADHTSWVRREPIGVVGQVTPWNYPLLMMIWKIAPALAAGNTIVLKPSDTTPASSTLLAELVPGVPAAGRAQRRLRRPRHRPRAGGAPDPADGGDHRFGARRHGGRRLRRRRPQAGPPRARRQGAGDRLRRRRHREGRRGHRRCRALQRRPGLHRRHAGAGRARASTTSSSPR